MTDPARLSPGLRVLSIDDDETTRRLVANILQRSGATVQSVSTVADALKVLGSDQRFDILVVDLHLTDGTGVTVIKRAREVQPWARIIVLSGTGAARDFVDAMRAGASDFIPKPCEVETLLAAVRGPAVETPASAPQPAAGRRHAAAAPLSADGPVMVGDSPRMRTLLDLITRVAAVPTTVLITGETGTGKEVVARSIHTLSARAAGPFVAINCGAIPEQLIESELFGHARGSFTGASEKRTGRFVQANNGTIFLDEIGELPLSMQVRLLRVLQDRQVTPVGDSRAVHVDIRVLAATNRDLQAMVRAGSFREDLLFRLNVVHLQVPALRERTEDILALFRLFLARSAAAVGQPVTLAPDGESVLVEYPWPGNVRELENFAERVAVLAGGGVCDAARVRSLLQQQSSHVEAPRPAAAASAASGEDDDVPVVDGELALTASLERAERDLIDKALQRAGGNKSAAARMLGINRTTLVEKLKRRKDV